MDEDKKRDSEFCNKRRKFNSLTWWGERLRLRLGLLVESLVSRKVRDVVVENGHVSGKSSL